MPGLRLPFGSRLSGAVLYVAIGVVATAVVVQTTRTGIDVLALLVAILLLLILERTVGDWVAEALGPTMATLVFAAAAAAAVLFLLSESGQARARHALSTAEARGYRGLLLQSESPAEREAARKQEEEELARKTKEEEARQRAEAERARRTGQRSGGDGNRPEGLAQAGPPPAEGRPTGGPARRRPVEPDPPRIARISVTPAVGTTGRATVLEARVLPTPTEPLSVVFSVNGKVLSTERVDDGLARTEFTAEVAGLYTVRARLTGEGRYSQAEAVTTLNVLPPRD